MRSTLALVDHHRSIGGLSSRMTFHSRHLRSFFLIMARDRGGVPLACRMIAITCGGYTIRGGGDIA
jgi:hypothetical protein